MSEHTEQRGPVVRPRTVWGGLGLGLLGAALIGLGIVLGSAPVAVGGCVALAAGAALAYRGGLASETRGRPSIEEAVKGDTHHGRRPSSRIEDEELQRKAAARSRRTDRILAKTHGGSPPPLAPLGAALLVATAALLIFAVMSLYPRDALTPTRVDGAIGTVLMLAAFRILTARSAALVSASLAMFVGLVLMVLAAVTSDSTTVQNVRVLTGVLAATGSLTCLVSPARRPGA
jgi:hypothetical protein